MPISRNEILRLLKGARNGFYYGAKVRFMHSFVMFILFRKKTVREELIKIVTNALQHGTKLAKFVFLFKAVVLLQQKVFKKDSKFFHFVAGGLCGWYVFRKKTPIDQQIGIVFIIFCGVKYFWRYYFVYFK